MKLRAIAKPTDAPMPAVPPAPTAALAAITSARIDESLVAWTSTFPLLTTTLPSATEALVRLRMMFFATAPAPLTAIPAVPPPPMASDAADVVASIRETVVASITTPPRVVRSVSSALSMKASTLLPMWFAASATPTEKATPPVPPKAAAIVAAPATDSIADSSCAPSVTLPAVMPAAPGPLASSPSTKALMFVAILLVADTPAPLTPTPPVLPPAIAAEPASTSASIVAWLAAVMPRLPVVTMLEFRAKAWTSAGERLPARSQPIMFSAIDTPIEAPTPAFPPMPTATAAAATVALISAVLSAVIETLPACDTVLLSTKALVRVRVTFRDRAPAPLTASPPFKPPIPAASDAAIDRAVIDPSASSQSFVSE